MAKQWTKTDEKRVKAVLKRVSDACGGWQALANALWGKGASRGTVEAWSRRGRVPVANIAAVVKIAEGHGIEVVAGDLHPHARSLASAA